MTLEEYLSVKQAVARLKLKENTIRHWMSDGKIQFTKLTDSDHAHVMIPVSEIIRIEKQRELANKWLTVDKVMKLTGFCRLTIYDFIRKEFVPYMKYGNQYRIDPDGLEKYLNRKVK